MNSSINIKEMARLSKAASHQLKIASTEQKNATLKTLIKNLQDNKKKILEANFQDIKLAKINQLNPALIERLSLVNKFESMIHDLEEIIKLPDPIGETLDHKILPNQLNLIKYAIPIGVIGVIYESRPNVTIDVSALAIKSGNCALLKGGSETLHTNTLLVNLIQNALLSENLPIEAIQLMTSSDLLKIKEFLQLHEFIDIIIPRGNASLQEFCKKNSTIPVITGGVGICHLFVDETANLESSLEVILNAKTQRPTVSNALDTLLVHEKIASKFIPQVVESLEKKGVSFRLDQKAWNILNNPSFPLAQDSDWQTEWLDLILGIKVVENLKQAIEHIQQYSGGNSDGILTEDRHNAEYFIKEVDSAVVYVNASTRFTDGTQFGLGSEVAVSTQKLHARGPIGLQSLTSYKWVVLGNYQVRN